MRTIPFIQILAAFFLCSIDNYSQTNFDQGDLIIVGVNANNAACSGVTAEDKVSLISFVDITPGTAIQITDNGWQRTTANLWGDTEGFYTCTYNGPGNITAGTVFTFIFPNAASPTCPGWTFTTINTINLNSGGDQLYVMQAGIWSQGTAANHDAIYTGGRFLAAFNTGTTWNNFGSSTQQSGLHPSVPCVSFAVTGAASDFVRYSGPTTITNRYNWYLRFTTIANWTSTDGSCANYNTNFTLTSILIDNSYTTATWDGSTDNNWFDCANWSTNRVPNEFTDVIIPNVTNNPIIDYTDPYSDNFQDTARCHNILIDGEKLEIVASVNNVLVVQGNLTINSTANSELDMSDGTPGNPDGKIFIKGNWINSKSETDFKQGDSHIIFWGGNNQTISTVDVTNEEIFFHVTINKSGGTVTLNDNIQVGGNSGDPTGERIGILNLTSGNIITGANYVWVVNPSITSVSGGSVNSFVDGNFRRQSNTINIYDFPCGDGTRFMRAGIRTTSTNLTTVEVDAQNTGYGIYSPLEPGLFDVSHLRWWEITKISGTNTVFVRLYWLGTPASEGITNVADLVVAHYSNRNHAGAVSTLQWWNRGRSAGNSSALISDGYVEASESVGTFSPFTLSTLTPLNPLPVELLSFNINCKNGTIHAEWNTATEINNHYFEIEGSTNAINYHLLVRLFGAGNSNAIVSYQSDITNISGDTYFRLKQVDYNGNTTIYATVYQICLAEGESLKAYYNGSGLELTLPSGLSNDISYSITDMSGKIIVNEPLSYFGKIIGLNDPYYLANGIYIVGIRDNSNGKNYYTKIFIN